MNRRQAAFLFALFAAAQQGCEAEENNFARAFVANHRSQLVGGPAALAEPGDFVIENDRIRVAILGPSASPGPGLFGGGIIDVDLRRPRLDMSAQEGLDQFGEMFPQANMTIPHPAGTGVRILDDGSRGGPAKIEVTGKTDNYLDAVKLLSGFFRLSSYRIVYELRPGESFLRVHTEVNTPQKGEPPVQLDGFDRPASIMKLLIGDQFSTEKILKPGVGAGDYLFFGDRLSIFASGVGFDEDSKIRDRIFRGGNTIDAPGEFDFLAAVGDRVSYAYFSPSGKVLVPLFAASFTATFTGGRNCLVSESDDEECDNAKTFYYERMLGVGRGDVASAIEPYYRAKGVRTGPVKGYVFDERTGKPVSGADVFVFEDPGVSPATGKPPRTLDELVEVNRLESKTMEDPDGSPRIVSHFRTDVGLDTRLDGSFGGALPEGEYYLAVRTPDREPSRPVPVTIRSDHRIEVAIPVPSPALVKFDVVDEYGDLVPAKITVGQCFPECSGETLNKVCAGDSECDAHAGEKCNSQKRCQRDDCPAGRICDLTFSQCVPETGCRDDAGCDIDEVCLRNPKADTGACTCRRTAFLDLAYGDPLLGDNIKKVVFTSKGEGSFAILPGVYEAVFSRGFEYSVDRVKFRATPSAPVLIHGNVARVVDTRGWVAGDFHVHTSNSFDAAVKPEDRIISMMAEGVEVVGSTDHDYITDLRPYVRKLKAEKYIQTITGMELTTMELGHFLAFPLRFDATLPENGAPDWTGQDPLKPGGNPKGSQLLPAEIFNALRDRGEFAHGDTIIIAPHPQDGFFGYLSQFGYDQFTGELKPGMLQRFSKILGNPSNFSWNFEAMEVFNGKRFELVRTPTISEVRGFNAELARLGANPPASAEELRAAEAALGRGFIERIIARSIPEQEAWLGYNGKTKCMPRTCRSDSDCSPPEYGGCDAAAGMCLSRVCSSDGECDSTRNERCDVSTKRCSPPADDPCADFAGQLDDWFSLLNRGIVKVGMGNSDTHTLSKIESGLPRNFLKVRGDAPIDLSPLEIVASLRNGTVTASYGPFVEIEANGRQMGSIAAADGGKALIRVRVQSPLWFDVNRIEIYRNGRLWRLIDEDWKPEEGDRLIEADLRLPNTRVVNFDAVLADRPGRDAWYVAVAYGVGGKTLAPVYTSLPVPAIEFVDVTRRLIPSLDIPGLEGLTSPSIPRVFPMIPYATTNPVWVDVDGDGGFTPPKEASPSGAEAEGALTREGGNSVEADGTPAESMKPLYFQLLFIRAMERLAAGRGDADLTIE